MLSFISNTILFLLLLSCKQETPQAAKDYVEVKEIKQQELKTQEANSPDIFIAYFWPDQKYYKKLNNQANDTDFKQWFVEVGQLVIEQARVITATGVEKYQEQKILDYDKFCFQCNCNLYDVCVNGEVPNQKSKEICEKIQEEQMNLDLNTSLKTYDAISSMISSLDPLDPVQTTNWFETGLSYPEEERAIFDLKNKFIVLPVWGKKTNSFNGDEHLFSYSTLEDEIINLKYFKDKLGDRLFFDIKEKDFDFENNQEYFTGRFFHLKLDLSNYVNKIRMLGTIELIENENIARRGQVYLEIPINTDAEPRYECK